MPIFVLYYVLYYQQDEEALDSFILRSYLRYKKGPDLSLAAQSTICSTAF